MKIPAIPNNTMTYRGGDQHPRFMKERENDPKVYGFICPGCECRYGDAQDRGWIDILRCEKCYIKLETYDLEKRKRHCSRMREYSRERYRASKDKRANAMLQR